MTTSISSMSSQIASSLFSKIDTKNQGYIDKAQLSSTSSDSDSSANDEAFNALDSDSDGKVTKSELTKGIESLLSSLSSSSVSGQENAIRPPPPDGPPPEDQPLDGNGDESDSGLTKDQMTKMASETKDSKLASLLKDVSDNFDSADTNKDGKVSREEAMAYEKSKENSSSTAMTNNSSGNEVAMKKIAELLAKYASDSANTIKTSSSSSVSVTA